MEVKSSTWGPTPGGSMLITVEALASAKSAWTTTCSRLDSSGRTWSELNSVQLRSTRSSGRARRLSRATLSAFIPPLQAMLPTKVRRSREGRWCCLARSRSGVGAM
ncbi:hypothetical protein BON30_06900 [Cystobacter ferrugineus]|uniref:Uncharacterized protein n=1 Tax=Cystobacter ferrugineus TaxID=83449 RepID=A0A1L9BEJ6_9BACT|nr:hypothetical protein BON30_06900 [Cystobacter ferrugineus]